MAKTDLDVVQLMVKLVAHETGSISKVDYVPQKPEFACSAEGETHLDRATPESQGISSSFLKDFLCELSDNQDCNIHKFMFVRNGRVICETGFSPFETDTWHITHSMCKSLTGMAIGLLVDDGKLNLTDHIVDIFGSKGRILSSLRLKDLTVWNLLTMTSGVQFNEAGIISGNHWRRSFLESGTSFNPGSRFEYNSMNSYMLSAIVTEITGQSMFDFIKPRILDPLGIRRIFWESCPEHITKGGWGLFMRAEDMAKLGLLYLNSGRWNGQQILSEEWVKMATKEQIKTGIEGSMGYGFQLWAGDNRPGEFTFNGMLGQNVYCYPDINSIVVVNAGNSEVFQKGTMTDIIRKYMGKIETSDTDLKKDFEAESILRHIERKISGRISGMPIISGGGWDNRCMSITGGTSFGRKIRFDKLTVDSKRRYENLISSRTGNQFIRLWQNCLNGCTYELDMKGIGIFPLMMQVFHNNFTDGISEIGFKVKNGHFYMVVHEGDRYMDIECGSGDSYGRNSINMHGEIYQLAVKTVFTTDEYDRMVIRNDLIYTEEAASRIMNIYFGTIGKPEQFSRGGHRLTPPDNIEIRMDETPGSDMMIGSLKSITTDSRLEALLMNKLAENGAMGALDETIRYTVKPIIRGKLITEA